MSEIIKITLVLFLILFLIRKKLNIGYVLLIAAAALFILYGMDAPRIAATVKKTVFSSTTIKLLLALSLIRVLELILREKNILATMTSTAKILFKKKRAVIISMPMLIGMLPSLGGAYFSAPMVKEATSGIHMSREEKAFINYWFRHPWEWVLPLYPGILLASAVSNIPLYTLIKANLTYALLLLVTGFLFAMRGIEKDAQKVTVTKKFMNKAPSPLPSPSRGEGYTISPPLRGGDQGEGDLFGVSDDRISTHAASKTRPRPLLKKELASFLPIMAVLLLVVFLHMELHYALLATIVPLLLFYRYSAAEIFRVMKYGFAFEVILLIFGIMLFKETLETSGAVRNLSSFFIQQKIPLLPIICILPFATGLLTGLTVGFVGSTFPLLISISGGAPLANITLAFAAGFIGVLLSPVHLCLILTKEYFKADMWGMYKRMLPASAVIFVAALIEYTVLR